MVAVELEMVISVDDLSEPCYESETVQFLREVKERAERGDVDWLASKGKVYAADATSIDFFGLAPPGYNSLMGNSRIRGRTTMVAITLNEEQTRQVQASSEPAIPIVDQAGSLMGYFRRPPFTAEEIAEANRLADAGGPWYSTAELLERLSKLKKPE